MKKKIESITREELQLLIFVVSLLVTDNVELIVDSKDNVD